MCNVYVLSSQDNFHCKNPRCAKKLVGRHLDVSEQLTGNDRILDRISSDKKRIARQLFHEDMDRERKCKAILIRAYLFTHMLWNDLGVYLCTHYKCPLQKCIVPMYIYLCFTKSMCLVLIKIYKWDRPLSLVWTTFGLRDEVFIFGTKYFFSPSPSNRIIYS